LAPKQHIGLGAGDYAPRATKAEVRAAVAAIDQRNRARNRARRIVAADKTVSKKDGPTARAELQDYILKNPGKVGKVGKAEKKDNTALSDWAQQYAKIRGQSPEETAAKADTGPAAGGLLDIGGDILKFVNLGSAAGAYGLSHVYDGLSKMGVVPKEKKGAMSWDEAQNGGNAKGIFTQMGAPDWLKQWGGLATDIIADPAWLLAPVKMASAAEKGVKAGEAIVDAAKVGDVAMDAAKGGSKVKTMLSKFLNREHMGVPSTRPVEAVKQASTPGKAVKHSAKIVPGGQFPGEHMQMAHGMLVDNRWFAAKTPHNGTRIFELDDVGHIQPNDAMLSKKFSSPTAAVKWIRAQSHRDPVASLEPKHFNAQGGTISDLQQQSDIRRALMQGEMGKWQGNQKLGIKLGLGKPNTAGGKGLNGLNVTLRTPFTVPGRAIGSMSGSAGLFRRDPMERVAHRAATSTREQVQGIEGLFGKSLDERFPGLSDMDKSNINDVLANDHMYLHIEGQTARPYGEHMRELLKAQGKWTPEMDRALNFARDRVHRMGKLEGVKTDGIRGDYFPQVMSKEAQEAAREAHPKNPMFSRSTPPSEIANKSRVHESSLNYYNTAQEYANHLIKNGGWDPADAKAFAEHMDQQSQLMAANPYYADRAGEIRFREAAGQDPLTEGIARETDVFKVLTAREREHAIRQHNQSIEDAFIQNGWAERVPIKVQKGGEWTTHPYKTELKFTDDSAAKMWQRIQKRFNAQGVEGTLSSTTAWRRWQVGMAHLKGMLTTANPAHPVGNAAGDSFNNLVVGNWRHALGAFNTLLFRPSGAGKAVKRGTAWAKLSTRDEAALKKTFKIGDQEYTGAEIYTLSHMMGLGKGYVGEDIAHFIKMNESSKNPATATYRLMQRYNATREDAVRMQTWFRHLQSGDDPVSAMQKTLVGTFDYGDLTDFEKNTMRHMFMFYTWMRKNTALQAKGPFMKPGLYSATQSIEDSRPKEPGEAAWASKAGLIPIPGWGNVQSWAPWADLHKFSPGESGSWMDQFGKSVLSGLNPVVKAPLELYNNKNFFTGGPIRKYPGQNQPSGIPWVDQLAQKLHLSEPTRQKQGDPLVDASPGWLAYAVHQLGPLVTDTARISGGPGKPDYSSPADMITSISGIGRRVKKDPDAARKATVAAAKRKADATRKKNATKPDSVPVQH
jgi:hypothetical protein